MASKERHSLSWAQLQSRALARSAPSFRVRSFAHTTLSATISYPATVLNPQSTPAMTRLLTVIADIDPGNKLFLDYGLHRRLDLTAKLPFVDNFAALLADQQV
ncbi:MAG: hypothetical protein HY268_23345 [Deltaproteobacteria bacterium]|nr:hypothetical protein [Deltaproteobacteria bacterium]